MHQWKQSIAFDDRFAARFLTFHGPSETALRLRVRGLLRPKQTTPSATAIVIIDVDLVFMILPPRRLLRFNFVV
jgi:hypothetical protein